MKKIILFFIICFSLTVFAKETVKPLFILGKQAKEITLYYSSQLTIDQKVKKTDKKDQIIVHVEGDSKIKIGVPSGEIHVVLQKVNKINVQNLKDVDISVSLKNGDIHINKSKGKFKISLDKGIFNFKNNSGELTAHLFSVPTVISKFNGSAQILSYSSPVSVDHSKGRFNIQSYSSALNLDQMSGRLRFHVEKSNVHLRLFKGDVAGYSNTGSVTGSLIPDKAEIETGSGMIRLYFQSSKARVSAQSWEGRVYAPVNFYTDRAGGVYKAHGSIKNRGDVAGQVFLKSQSGKIYIL